jgi:endonuclease/exonuclease/phosphatase family metal-dependent hydrolase
MPTLPRRLWVLLAAPVFAVVLLLPAACDQRGQAPTAPPEGYLFCFWNVEDLFDDHRDKHHAKVDDEFDSRFANNPDVLEAKLKNLSKVLLSLNDGKGPDIFAFAEVESDRAADLLRQQLNKDLGDKGTPYNNLLFKETRAGRHISTGIITRLPVIRDRTRKLDSPHRILEGHLIVDGHELVVIASHWTSRVTKGSREGRNKYGDLIYGRFKAMYKANRNIDFLVCGDFNDDPDDEGVVKHLRATGDRQALTADPDEPKLFSLSLGKMKDLDHFGTLKYRGKWNLFDQVAVSPGLLDDKGWTVLPETLTTVRKFVMKSGRPSKFDARTRQGFSDHCPVTVRLKVQSR